MLWGDDDDRFATLELAHQVLDPSGRDQVQVGARLIHQDDLGVDRDRARRERLDEPAVSQSHLDVSMADRIRALNKFIASWCTY